MAKKKKRKSFALMPPGSSAEQATAQTPPRTDRKPLRVRDVLGIIPIIAIIIVGFFLSAKTLIGFLMTGKICTGKRHCYAQTFSQAPWSVTLNVAESVFFTLLMGGLIYGVSKTLGDKNFWRGGGDAK